MRIVRSLIISAGALALAGTASAQDIWHNFQVKVGVSSIQPDEKSSISVIGGEANISDEYVPTLQIEYFFNDNISAELLCCIATHDVKAENTALGTVDLGQVSHFPPTLTVKYHWTDMGAFQPYLGAGLNYTTFYDDKLPAGGPVTAIHYDDSLGGALQAGFDYKFDDHWSLNVDVRKVWISSDVAISAGATQIAAKVDVNPLILTVGSGYRF
ncbi:MAG: OmpW family outer membrane protein [Hyphomonadaceae bacterium]